MSNWKKKINQILQRGVRSEQIEQLLRWINPGSVVGLLIRNAYCLVETNKQTKKYLNGKSFETMFKQNFRHPHYIANTFTVYNILMDD